MNFFSAHNVLNQTTNNICIQKFSNTFFVIKHLQENMVCSNFRPLRKINGSLIAQSDKSKKKVSFRKKKNKI